MLIALIGDNVVHAVSCSWSSTKHSIELRTEGSDFDTNVKERLDISL